MDVKKHLSERSAMGEASKHIYAIKEIARKHADIGDAIRMGAAHSLLGFAADDVEVMDLIKLLYYTPNKGGN